MTTSSKPNRLYKNMKLKQKEKEYWRTCHHEFWKDRNGPECFNCGKTEEELFKLTYKRIDPKL